MDAETVWRPLVLLVDDDVRTALTLARMLREDGFDVDFAADGAAAMARLMRDPFPDILVTDMMMPCADGLAVTRYARSQCSHLPVFVVTGYPHLVTRIADSIEPAVIVLTKPLHYEGFSEQLRSASRGPLGSIAHASPSP